MARRKTRSLVDDTGEFWAKIVSHRSNYHISRKDAGDECLIDDEAELEVIATIDAITPSQRKHLGQEVAISLLTAERYAPKQAASSPFFGSVNLRGCQHSALAYLPSTPFWALPTLIRERESWVCIGWSFMRRGHADLTSVFIGDGEDRKHLLELGGNALATSL